MNNKRFVEHNNAHNFLLMMNKLESFVAAMVVKALCHIASGVC